MVRLTGGGGGVALFAVEDTSGQVCWRGLPEGTVVRAGDARAEVAPGGGAGAASLDGLPPATRLDLVVTVPGQRPRRAGRFRTLAPPPGALLSRFATVNDVHVGEQHFGFLGTIREHRPAGARQDYAARCLQAALEEAVAWGAEAVLAKGDLTWNGRLQQWDDVGALLAGAGVPAAAVLGNHDVGPRAVDGRPVLAAHGVLVGDEPFFLELPGIRIVLAHSAEPRHSGGRVRADQREQVAALTAGAAGAAFVGLHHYLQHFRAPLSYPPGIPGDEAQALLQALAAANPATLVSVGHSHRHRRRRYGPLVVTQIGATMHYPGTWAGYAVHEGGIRQVVCRITGRSSLEWTEQTRKALLGAWPLWSTGLLSHRCFSHTWPAR